MSRLPTLITLFLTLFVVPFSFAPGLSALGPDSRITLPDGQRIFVAGFNLAWIDFGNDVGDQDFNVRAFARAMKSVADAGGNTMRIWLSTNGRHDPKFGPDGLVSGLGSKTISNVQKMLKTARENRMFLLPVLLTHNFLQDQDGVNLDYNTRLLSTDEGLAAYIDNAVVPLVKAIGNDPNLLAWEIANEAEGMASPGGWTSARISKFDIQCFTNRIAGAIKRAVPGVLVSTGTVSADKLPWYADTALIAAGGDTDGVLDFYMVHYYGWNGPANSPFTHPASWWRLDKPLVVGEFASSSWDPSTRSSSKLQDSGKIGELLPWLFDTGYAGGLYWQFQRDGGDPWMLGFATAGPALKDFADSHREALRPGTKP